MSEFNKKAGEHDANASKECTPKKDHCDSSDKNCKTTAPSAHENKKADQHGAHETKRPTRSE